MCRDLYGAEAVAVCQLHSDHRDCLAAELLTGRNATSDCGEQHPGDSPRIHRASNRRRIGEPARADLLQRRVGAATFADSRGFEKRETGIEQRRLRVADIGRWIDPAQTCLVPPHRAALSLHRHNRYLTGQEPLTGEKAGELAGSEAVTNGNVMEPGESAVTV